MCLILTSGQGTLTAITQGFLQVPFTCFFLWFPFWLPVFPYGFPMVPYTFQLPTHQLTNGRCVNLGRYTNRRCYLDADLVDTWRDAASDEWPQTFCWAPVFL